MTAKKSMFNKIALRGWRQFRNIDVAFHPRLTILTGSNGAGKTTLLNLVSRHFGWGNTSDRGFVTEKKLDLNRRELVERRQERLEAAATLVDQIVRANNPAIPALLRDPIAQKCESDEEYSFVVRAYVAGIQGLVTATASCDRHSSVPGFSQLGNQRVPNSSLVFQIIKKGIFIMRFGYVRQCLIATTLTCMFHASFAANDLPRLEDPEMQAMLTTIQGEHGKYLANRDTYLSRPSEVKPWPCKVTAEDLKNIGIPASVNDNPEKNRQLIDEANLSKDAYKLITLGLIVYPVKAECKGGKLDGPLDYWIETKTVMVTPQKFVTNTHALNHVQFSVKEGQPFGTKLGVVTALSSETTYLDPATSAMMAKQKRSKADSVTFSVSSVTPLSKKPSVSMSHTVVDGVVTVNVTTTRVYGDNRSEITHYGSFGDPSHRDWVQRYKGDKRHGAQISYPGLMGGKYPVPGSSECWEDGERVLTSTCDVD